MKPNSSEHDSLANPRSSIGVKAVIARAQQLMRENALDTADALLTQALTEGPGDAAALYLRGVIANRRQDYVKAIAVLQQAIAANPRPAPAWLALGNAHAGLDGFAAATDAYREAVSRQPRWVDAHYNLGLTLKRQGNLADAARAFHAAWVLDRTVPEAAQQCVDTTAAWVRAGDVTRAPVEVEIERPPASFTIVVCSIDDAKLERVTACYRRVFAGTDHEIVSIRDARSLAEAYNRAIGHSANDIVLLSHDDVDILAPDFARRLARHLQRFDAVGIAGGARMTGPAPSWCGHPHLRGWVTHRPHADPVWRADVFDPRPVADDAVVLDGVLLAARREVFARVPFDAETFDGFHLYDVDWSYRASQAGFRLGVTGDLLLVHESRGSYDSRWQHYARRFCAKYALGEPAPPAQGQFYEAAFDDAEQVRAFYARLTRLQSDSGHA